MAGPEAELMARYCNGDRDAFDALYTTVAPPLFTFILGLVRDRPTAEDLLQLTFLKLHEARGLYVRGVSPMPWLFTIARRTCIDEVRRRRRSRTLLADDPRSVPDLRADLHGVAEALSRDESFSDETVKAIASLPDAQRSALLLTTVDGHTHEEAAAISGSTATAMKLRTHRAYVALRQRLRRNPA